MEFGPKLERMTPREERIRTQFAILFVVTTLAAISLWVYYIRVESENRKLKSTINDIQSTSNSLKDKNDSLLHEISSLKYLNLKCEMTIDDLKADPHP